MTEEQIKKLWEWCGFKWIQKKEDMIFGNVVQAHWDLLAHWQYPDSSNHEYLPMLGLNSLFKWAVPKLIPSDAQGGIEFRFYPGGTQVIITCEDEAGFNERDYFLENSRDPVEALAQAIYKAAGL